MNPIYLWISWDPSRELFTIPWIDRPVGWYGLFFAFGIFIAYFLMVRFLTRKIRQTDVITEAYIASWFQLLQLLQEVSTQNRLNFPDRAKRWLATMRPTEKPGAALKQEVLQLLQNAAKTYGRDYLTESLGSACYSARTLALSMADTLCWFAVIGVVVGARLGHVFFYSWPYFSHHPLDIIKVWEGGLASHGGIIGLLLALALYLPKARRYLPQLTYLGLVDLIAIAAPFTGFCIRIGNFFNQEIVGIPTTLPWGILFGHPIDGDPTVPLHPVQLYEALVYLALFCFLYRLWQQKGESLPAGVYTGYVLSLGFGLRILLESVKATQGELFFDGWVQTGQLLSVPFVLIGLGLLWRSRYQLEFGQNTAG